MTSRSLRWLWLAIACASLSCQTGPRATREAPARASVAAKAEASTTGSALKKSFGAKIGDARALSLAEVLTNPTQFRDQTITVEGEVRSACTRRGCWMELAQGADPKLAGCRVTFKDYGFFVPTDSAGAHARVEGRLGLDTVPAERVAHLESEGGRFPNKHPDGSADEVRLVATGVELSR